MVFEIMVFACRDPDEGLVNRIDFHLRLQTHENIHNPLGDIAIQRVVGREDSDLVFADEGFLLKIGCAHADAKGLGLIGPGNDTAVVVGKHHHRSVRQVRPKKAFTGNIEIVAVD